MWVRVPPQAQKNPDGDFFAPPEVGLEQGGGRETGRFPVAEVQEPLGSRERALQRSTFDSPTPGTKHPKVFFLFCQITFNIYLMSFGYYIHMPRKKLPDKNFIWTAALAEGLQSRIKNFLDEKLQSPSCDQSIFGRRVN